VASTSSNAAFASLLLKLKVITWRGWILGLVRLDSRNALHLQRGIDSINLPLALMAAARGELKPLPL
jgi:hypothetical protein